MTPNGDGAHVYLSDYGNSCGKRAVISVHYARKHISNYEVERLRGESEETQFARALLIADEIMIRVGVPVAEVFGDRWTIDQDAESIRALPLLASLLAAGSFPNDVVRALIADIMQRQDLFDRRMQLSSANIPAISLPGQNTIGGGA